MAIHRRQALLDALPEDGVNELVLILNPLLTQVGQIVRDLNRHTHLQAIGLQTEGLEYGRGDRPNGHFTDLDLLETLLHHPDQGAVALARQSGPQIGHEGPRRMTGVGEERLMAVHRTMLLQADHLPALPYADVVISYLGQANTSLLEEEPLQRVGPTHELRHPLVGAIAFLLRLDQAAPVIAIVRIPRLVGQLLIGLRPRVQLANQMTANHADHLLTGLRGRDWRVSDLKPAIAEDFHDGFEQHLVAISFQLAPRILGFTTLLPFITIHTYCRLSNMLFLD